MDAEQYRLIIDKIIFLSFFVSLLCCSLFSFLVLSTCTFPLYLFSSGVKGKLSDTLPGNTDYRGKEH
jgi:hypothetical protein